MTSYFLRYLRGDRVAVWNELRALGPVPDHLLEDAAAVADETMARVASHVARISAALPELDFRPSYRQLPPHTPPSRHDLDLVDSLTIEIGGLPLLLDACLRNVGEVWFAGDCPALELGYRDQLWEDGSPPGPEYPDPLCLPSADYLRDEWDGFTRSGGLAFRFAIAPDESLKANQIGGQHTVDLPSLVADPVLHGVAGRPGITLLEYLRTSIEWGGFPGFSFAPDRAPRTLHTLGMPPDF